MSECYTQHTKFNYNDWFKGILSYIKDNEIKSKLIDLNKYGQLMYTEHCGSLEYFDINGNKQEIEPYYLNGKRITRPRRKHEHNLCFQYCPNKELTGERRYITLKIDD